jgi:hypothetical protein
MVMLEHRKNGGRFPVPSSNHQRLILPVAAKPAGTSGEKQKGRRGAGLFAGSLDERPISISR